MKNVQDFVSFIFSGVWFVYMEKIWVSWNCFTQKDCSLGKEKEPCSVAFELHGKGENYAGMKDVLGKLIPWKLKNFAIKNTTKDGK